MSVGADACHDSPFHEIVRQQLRISLNPIRSCVSYPRTAEEEIKTKNVWLKGHTGLWPEHLFFDHFINTPTDFGTITILYSQPVAALQIFTPENNWKWVKHIDNALVRLSTFIDMFRRP